MTMGGLARRRARKEAGSLEAGSARTATEVGGCARDAQLDDAMLRRICSEEARRRRTRLSVMDWNGADNRGCAALGRTSARLPLRHRPCGKCAGLGSKFGRDVHLQLCEAPRSGRLVDAWRRMRVEAASRPEPRRRAAYDALSRAQGRDRRLGPARESRKRACSDSASRRRAPRGLNCRRLLHVPLDELAAAAALVEADHQRLPSVRGGTGTTVVPARNETSPSRQAAATRRWRRPGRRRREPARDDRLAAAPRLGPARSGSTASTVNRIRPPRDRSSSHARTYPRPTLHAAQP